MWWNTCGFAALILQPDGRVSGHWAVPLPEWKALATNGGLCLERWFPIKSGMTVLTSKGSEFHSTHSEYTPNWQFLPWSLPD